jgi:hypothetical protein
VNSLSFISTSKVTLENHLVHLQFFITQIKLWNDYIPIWFYLIVIDFLAVRLTVVIIL